VSTERSYGRALGELRAADAESFGGKSAGLGELIAAGIPVPPGFAISAAAFTAFLEEAGLGERVEAVLAALDPTDAQAVAFASHHLGESMRSAPVPQELRAELARRYAELDERAEAPVAVRSSALGEDSHEATFAGQQESYLWVRGADSVADAVRDCWVSLYSPPAISYRARMGSGGAGPAAMGVTVQLMVDAEISGVMFTCNPVSGDPSVTAINASWGLGLAVVGGEVTPDYYLVSKVTGEVLRQDVCSKDVQYVAGPERRGAVRTKVPPERREAACLDAARLAELVALARSVHRHFGCHQDIEWAIDRDGGLHVVQSRPVTAAPKPAAQAPAAASAIALVMSTFGAAGSGGGGS
jgi:pyruvate,water dikinase